MAGHAAAGLEHAVRALTTDVNAWLGDRRQRRLATGLVALVIAVVIIVVVTERPGPETSAATSVVVARPGSSVVEPSSGRVWNAAAGTWKLGDQRLRVVRPSAASPSLLVNRTATANYTVRATFDSGTDGAGLVFRYVDPSNYWAAVEVFKFATWNVVRVVNGQTTELGNLGGLRCCPDHTLLEISTRRDGDVIFSVNGELASERHDPALADATTAGVIAGGPDPTKAVVTNFKVIHRVPGISPTTTNRPGQ